MTEPRGHAGMRGAVLTEASSGDAHAGVLFMDADGFHSCSYEGALAVAALCERHSLIVTERPGPLLLETAAGTLRVSRRARDTAGPMSTLVAPPAFVAHGGVAVSAVERPMRADLAWAGGFYAIVDSESAGVAIDGTRQSELRRAARAIAADVERRYRLSHPEGVGDEGVSGVIFTGAAHGQGAEFRTVTLTTEGRTVRGVSGAGLAAVMAVLHAMGLPVEHEGLTLEGPSGVAMVGRVAGITSVGDYPAIIPEIEATVWPTGEHTFMLDETDLLREGFVLE